MALNKNPLLDDEFLKELYRHREKEVFAKIIALTLQNDPIEEIQGQVTGGSVSLDGSSNVRRSCTLSLVAKDLNINQYYWGLKNRFKLYIGLTNTVGYGYEDIIWFPMGTYVISAFTTSQAVGSYTINITGKDKMTLLNGELSGSLFASVDFGKEEYYVDGKTTISYIPVKNIIREAVHAYADESWENIIVNDLDDYGIELLDYTNENNPMYLIFRLNENDNTKECWQYTLYGKDFYVYPIKKDDNGVYLIDPDTNEYVLETDENNIPKKIAVSAIEDNGYTYDKRIELDLGGIKAITASKFCIEKQDSQTGEMAVDCNETYTVVKVEAGQTCGYRLTDITYPGDLILSVGEPITAMLDKLVSMLGNFEYFYDIDGRFVFQRKPTFIDKTWNNIKTGNQNSYVTTIDETYAESAAYATPITWTFGDSFLITSYANNPALSNVRNDFSIWGTKASVAGAELPVHLRYAVDKKPTYYKTFDGKEWTTEIGQWWVKEGEGVVDITYDELVEIIKNETHEKIRKKAQIDIINGTLINTDLDEYVEQKLEEELTPEKIDIIIAEKGYRFVDRMPKTNEDGEISEDNTIYVCDWREIIFQMALDYRKHNHDDDFYLKVRTNNGLDFNNQWYYPSGRTGYEQYYVDMEGFWRQLYCPPQLMKTLYPSGTWTERDTSGGWQFSTTPITANTEKGIYFNKPDGIVYYLSMSHDDWNQLKWIDSWIEKQDINDGWRVDILEAPENLDFWFDFLEADESTDLVKYSVPAIGDRSKSVNDNMVKAIYFRETPTALYTTDLSTVERKSGYTYLQYNDELSSVFNISSQGKSAYDVMEEYINLYLYCIESISINSIPIYHLQPNTKVMVYDEDSKINGEYLINRITIPLIYNGIMSVSAVKSAEIIY